jgi:hypothetical protein
MRPFHDTRYSGALGWANRSVLRRSRFRRRFRFCVAIDSDKAKALPPPHLAAPPALEKGAQIFPTSGICERSQIPDFDGPADVTVAFPPAPTRVVGHRPW